MQLLSNVSVLPVLGVVDDSFALDVRVEPIVLNHAGFAKVVRKVTVEAMQHGALRNNVLRRLTEVLVARLVNDVLVAFDDV